MQWMIVNTETYSCPKCREHVTIKGLAIEGTSIYHPLQDQGPSGKRGQKIVRDRQQARPESSGHDRTPVLMGSQKLGFSVADWNKKTGRVGQHFTLVWVGFVSLHF